MTEEHRLENQRHYLECCRREGWIDAENKHLWLDSKEARADMGRGLFGLAFTNALDSIFIAWRERVLNVSGRTRATAGSITERIEHGWGEEFSSLTEEQKDFVLRVIDDVLDSAAYQFSIMLARFDHGDLSIRLTPRDDQQQAQPAVQIQPHGPLEMFQDVLDWNVRFGRGAKIGRPTLE